MNKERKSRSIPRLIAGQIYKLLLIIVIVLPVTAIIAFLWANNNNVSFISVLPNALFIAGVIVMVLGALVGVGYSERAVYGAGVVWGTGRYLHRTQKERFGRTGKQFFFMLFMVTTGIILIFLGYLIDVL